jgi:hypothetical protein
MNTPNEAIMGRGENTMEHGSNPCRTANFPRKTEGSCFPDAIPADEGRLGLVMCDRLAENGWQIERVKNGATADKPNAYSNKGAEICYEGRTAIERQRIILPNDPALVAQLTARIGWPNSRGRLELETKEKLRARGHPSPDRADAVLGAIMPAQGGDRYRRVERSHDDWRVASNSPRGRILV